METIKEINKVVVAIQLGLFGLGMMYTGFFYAALFFTIITGIVQIILGFVMVGIAEKRNQAAFYLALVVFYFAFMFYYYDDCSYPLNSIVRLGVPVLSFFYITFIIHVNRII